MKRFVLVLVLVGCNKADYTESPDGSIACNAGAHVFCAADAGSGCPVSSSDTDPRLKQLAPGTYAPGCVANFVEDSRDQGGDCIVQSICRCSAGADAGDPAHWTCYP